MQLLQFDPDLIEKVEEQVEPGKPVDDVVKYIRESKRLKEESEA